MAQIKIYGDIDSSSIFFVNSSVNPKGLGTVVASLLSTGRIKIERTDRFQQDGVTYRILFRKLNPSRVLNKDGLALIDGLGYSPQEVVDYINEQASLTGGNEGGDGTGTDLGLQTVDFNLDATTTSIMMSTGHEFGVNTIKAMDTGDGCITIASMVGDLRYFKLIHHTDVQINGVAVPGGLNDVINALNELFTVGPFEAIVISDPDALIIADVGGVDSGYTLEGSTAVDPIGDDLFTNSTSGNYAGMLTTSSISQSGEYFTFDIRGEGTIGFGLVHTQDSYDAGLFQGNANYADPTSFAVSNSAHYGYQFSHWFHPTPNGSWTNYGANTAYSMRSGWSNFNGTDEQADWLAGENVKVKVGIDVNGFISIETYRGDTGTFVPHSRTSYPVPQGSEFKLGIKSSNAAARVSSVPKVHLRAEVATDPTTVGDSSITVFGEGITGTLAGGISSSAIDNFDNDGFVTTETIGSIGEYFELDWSSGGDFNFGLFSENDHDVADLTTDTTSWSTSKYIFYGSEGRDGGGIQGARTDAGLGYTNIGDGTTADYKARVGFDASGRPTVWGSADAGATWFVFHRANASAPVGDYKFIMVAEEAGVVFDGLTKGTQTFAPTMYFRYVESPDGVFNYPLFATEEEANYYDEQEGGTGTSHTHVYVDDPSNTTWYMPDTNSTMTASVVPTSAQTFGGAAISWTEITSLTNADLAPSSFTIAQQYMSEGSALNLQLSPQDVGYVTSIANAPSWMSLSGGYLLQGTVPFVSSATDFTVDVTRTNSYGSVTHTLTISVADNLALSTISGLDIAYGNTASPNLVFADESFAAKLDTTVSQGQEITWTHKDYLIGGFLTTGGKSNFSSGTDIEPAGNWEVRFVNWTATLMHNFSAGWAVGGAQNVGDLDGATHKMVYKTDGYVEYYLNDVLKYTSASALTGDQDLYLMTPANYNVTTEIPVDFVVSTTGAGSTTAPSGFSSPLLQGEMGGTDILGNGAPAAATSTMTVEDGKRLIITEAWVEQNVLPYMDSDNDKVFLGVPNTGATLSNIQLSDFDMVLRLQKSGSSHKSLIYDNGSNQNEVTVNSLTDGYYNYALEWDGTDLSIIAHTTYGELLTEPSIADGGSFDRVITHSNFTLQSGNLPFIIATNDDGQVKLNPYFLGVTLPAAPVSNLTPWTKALDFSGSNEHAKMVSSSTAVNALRMGNSASSAGNNTDSGKTSNGSNARPWATSVVFKIDGNNSNQHIWNSGEGAGTNDDNIYLRLTADKNLFFGWGRGSSNNECRIATNLNTAHWYGIYVAFKGGRFNSSGATNVNLALAFDIRMATSEYSFPSVSSNLSTEDNWGVYGTTGHSMQKSTTGDFTIGGRGSNRNFHGKVASMVCTSLMKDAAIPTDAEIKLMITDPIKWVTDYKIGQTYRYAVGNTTNTFAIGQAASSYATQVYLMGDGTNDSYSNMIRNYINVSDQNYTKLQLNSMVSNDIETVNINGLS